MVRAQIEVSNKRKRIYTIVIFTVSLAILLAIILFTYRYKENLSFAAVMVLVITGLIIFLAGFLALVQGGRTIGYYCCGNCHEKFMPSVMSYMSTAHIPQKSYLKCPKCGKKNWCKKRIE